MDWWDMLEVREKDPRLGPIDVRWLAGLTVTIRLLELATIISVTCNIASVNCFDVYLSIVVRTR